ncbi:DUF2334 domain-containing protein [Paenibacillus sp. N3.4]|uniref:DUF2334 domain-containing protein n=1 Tax=Paenibacillus sp. N3.4 TaxID=2603222 RepID=UPI0011C6F043|nr:DUF2334 domain-containing protein [Paenibacillus sp. N3.4]TXK77951.1 polysaccharide deacetylase [Paenibacillus sp. N3.4]
MKNIIGKIRTIKESKKLVSEMGRKLQGINRSEEQLIPYINKPGIVISFDDSFRINHWYDYGIGKKQGYKDLFGFFDVKVTFNINAYHHYENQRELNQSEIDMLLELQANGHEIAHHGYRHRNAVEYSKTHGLNFWIENDIIPLFEWMEQQKHSITGEHFKNPVSYAYPGSKYNNETNGALIPRFYKIVRGYIQEDNLISMQHTGFSPSICIDKNVFPNVKLIKPALNYAKLTGKNLVLMCHSILPKKLNWDEFGWGINSKEAGMYRVSPKDIEYIIKEAKKIGLEFYTMAEAAGIATFIDPNLEKAIRNRLHLKNKWIYINDLINIKELDFEGMSISNLAGIEYFINLEKLNLKNNNILDKRLLNKLKNIKELDI